MTARTRTTLVSRPTRSLTTLAATACLALGVTSCSLVGSENDDTATGTPSGSSSEGLAEGDGTVVLLTHSDFYLPEEVVAAFEDETGYTLEVRPNDGVGTLANLVSAQAGAPTGDVVFGIDNTFGSRVLDSGAVAAYPGELPDGVEDDALPGDDAGAFVPVDNGNVCVNVDDTWFADNDLEPPATLDDLVDPTYADLLAIPSAASSSPGLAFLLTTIAAYGDDWPDYWASLMDNGAEVVAGWSEAYQGEFTQGGGGGDKPVVVSYDSSPAFTVGDDGTSSTSALLDTCYHQVEYAGLLDGAEDAAGGAALIDFLLSPTVQEALPESMYVFPVVDDTPLPDDWAQHAGRPTDPFEVDPADIEANREDWLVEWNDVVTR